MYSPTDTFIVLLRSRLIRRSTWRRRGHLFYFANLQQRYNRAIFPMSLLACQQTHLLLTSYQYWSEGKEHLFILQRSQYKRAISTTSSLRARKCFSPICSSSSSPNLWWLRFRRMMNVARGRWWGRSPTPCCQRPPLIESFPTSAAMTASTLSPALQVQSFALQEVPFCIELVELDF